MKNYIILAQMGNEEDWGWEEIDRTTNIDEAIAAAKQGARVYEIDLSNDLVDKTSVVSDSDNIGKLPF